MGEEPVNLVTPEVDHNFMPPSVQHALQIAQEANPVMFVAMHDVEAAQAQYDQAEGDFYPEFFIEASQEFGEELDGSPGDTDEFKAMLRMRYNLFSGGSDRAKARRAAYQSTKPRTSVTGPSSNSLKGPGLPGVPMNFPIGKSSSLNNMLMPLHAPSPPTKNSSPLPSARCWMC